MKSSMHLVILIAILVTLGFSMTAYQIFVLKTPITEKKEVEIWTVDAQINFDVRGSKSVYALFKIPPKTSDFLLTDELFIANEFGQNFDHNKHIVELTSRKVSGAQTLFYRVNVTRNMTESLVDDNIFEKEGETWTSPIELNGIAKVAADALIADIRQKSTNVLTFISLTISAINDESNSNVQLLLGKNKSITNKVKVVETLLSQAYIPMQRVHTIQLTPSTMQAPELWIASFVEVTKKTPTGGYTTSKGWYIFDPINGNEGLPDDRLIWWIGEEPVFSVDNAARSQVAFNIDKNELTALSLAKISDGGMLNSNSLYSLPINTQHAYKVMLIIPFGVLVILILRNVIGINALGTFTPVLIALAFRETGLIPGIIFFSLIVMIGLSVRSYLDHLKLQMLSRLSVVLSFVILLIVFLGIISFKLGINKGLSMTLFPMVILTMTIERLSISVEERGGNYAFKLALGTIFTSTIIYLIMSIDNLIYFVFTFPAILFILMGFMLAMGKYRGYRLSELIRFKSMAQKGVNR